MELSDIINEPLTIKFGKDGTEHKLRYFNLEDNVFLRETITDEKYSKLFSGESVDSTILAMIIYHQIEDKSEFAEIEIDDYDIDGKSIKRKIGGYKQLLRMITTENLNKLLCIFYELHFKSNPDIEEDKKKVVEIAQTYLMGKPVKQAGKK